jgi:secreted trypsin-like serine protease
MFKILNGTCEPYGSLPWTVQIQVIDENNNYRHHCGGTIITEDFIITAAHCFYERLEFNKCPVVNFINILRAAFPPIFFCQKITKPKC